MALNGLAGDFKGRILTNLRDPNAFEDIVGEHTVMYPTSEDDVSVAIKLSKESGRDVIIRSGRNSVSTDQVNGEGAIVINMEPLSDIHIDGSRVTVGPAVMMENFADTLYDHGLFLPFRDNLIKTVVAGVLSTEPGMLTRSAGFIRSYLHEIHVVKKDGTSVIATKDDDLFNAVLAKEDDSVISGLVFDALPEQQSQSFWMSFFFLPYREDTFKKLLTSAFETGKIPSNVDLAVKVILSTYGMPLVRVSIAGKDGSADREAAVRHIEHAVSPDNLGDLGFEIPPISFTGTEIVKAIVEGGDSGALSHGYISTKHIRLVRADRFPDFVDHYCKVIDAADGVDEDAVMYLPNVSMKSQVCLTTDDNISATAYLFVPPKGLSRHTDEQDKIEDYKRFLNHILPLDTAPPARRSLLPTRIGDRSIASGLEDDDLSISAQFDLRSIGKIFTDPLKRALRLPEPRIPGFKGEIFTRNDKQYSEKAYQYGTSSNPKKDMTPLMVAFPESVRDIQVAIAYGKQEDKNIVARSGGHQYSGLSSGGDDTIVLSMDHFKSLSAQKGKLATVGVGARLTKIAEFFKDNGITIPHGECPLVAIGGHCQTGGYGHFLRSFGLALDYVHSFNIVLADGEFMTVYRPTKGVDWKNDVEEVSKNDRIYWGVMGGGPNSFGILTDITFECIDDDEHANSLGHTSVGLFDKEAFRIVMKEVQKWTKEIASGRSDYLPDDLDMMATAVSTDLKFGFVNVNFIRNFVLQGSLLLEMVYGNEKGESASQADVDKARGLMTSIYDNVRGEHLRIVQIDAKSHTPLSHLSDSFVRRTGTTKDGREFRFPYEKRLNGTKLALTDKFVSEFVDLVDDSINDTDVRIVFQMGLGGGKYLKNKELGITSHSRRDLAFQVVYDVFYSKGKRDVALGYQKRMEGILEREFKEGESVRLIWGSYGDTDINRVWENYYDSEKLYQQLQNVKEDVDPEDVFHTRFTVQLPQ